MAEIPRQSEDRLDFKHVVDIDLSISYYGSLLDSDIYFSRQYGKDKWKDTTDANKLKLLYQATQSIDRLNFRGSKTATAQNLQFPRGGDLQVPKTIEHATYEEAWSILQGLNLESETRELQVKRREYGPIKTEYKDSNPFPNVTAGILSSVAWRLLLPYLRHNESIKITRV